MSQSISTRNQVRVMSEFRDQRKPSSYTPSQQARANHEALLHKAADLLAWHATRNAPLCKRIGRGVSAMEVRFSWPGVVEVFDPITGRLIARSEVGNPYSLAADFDPLKANLTVRSMEQ